MVSATFVLNYVYYKGIKLKQYYKTNNSDEPSYVNVVLIRNNEVHVEFKGEIVKIKLWRKLSKLHVPVICRENFKLNFPRILRY